MRRIDKIQQMLVNDFADFLIEISVDSMCEYCVGCECFSEDEDDICKKGLIQWLEEEAT